MGLKTYGIPGAAALAGGATGVLTLFAMNAGLAAAVTGGVSGAALSVGALYFARMNARQSKLQKAYTELTGELDDLKERQAQYDAKIAEIERRTIESPALVWRAATADIEVLGSLVSDLAKTVSEHEKQLGGSGGQTPAVSTIVKPASVPIPAPSPVVSPEPEWFEDDAELGFTADLPMEASSLALGLNDDAAQHMASPALVSELRTTLATALASERLELCLQPIVTLPQRKPRGYDASLRLKGEGGDLQTDAELRRIAAATGLEAELDKLLVERAVQVLRVLRARNKETMVCCAVAGSSLRSADFLTRLENLVRSDEKLARAVVLEISDADFRALEPVLADTTASLARLGVSLGLARLPDLRINVAGLVERRISQVRVGAQLLRNAAEAGGQLSDIHPADLAELLQRKGIDLLVSDVISEQGVLDLLDQAVPLAQGPIFGAARPVRPEVLAPKAVGATQSAQPRQADAKDPDGSTTRNARLPRQSFRSLLRRA
ncbi:MAG: EAL domain-containing protein [Beijerinckiaceae bacterium]